MISYNPKYWFRTFLRHQNAAIGRRLLPMALCLIAYAFLVAWLADRYGHLLPLNSNLKNISVLHSLLGFAISILVVFRTNTAYDRWWEGRKLWGSLVNNSRTLAINLAALLPGDDERNRGFFGQLIPRFALELKNHLQLESTRFALDEDPHPEIPDFDRGKHVPNQVASLLMARAVALQRGGAINTEHLLLINSELSSFMEVCGACERIKNTPIPYAYSAFIKQFIFFYVITLPLGFVVSLGYWIIPAAVFVFYVLASLELIAEEIEDPFGRDTNDLPMQRLTETIQKNVAEILA